MMLRVSRVFVSSCVVPALTFSMATALGASALVPVSGPSPFGPGQPTPYGDCAAVGTQFPDAEAEPYVVANPINPRNIVGIWSQDNAPKRGSVAAVSADGGSTWTPVVIPGLTVCSGADPDDADPWIAAFDPWLTFGPNGDLYAISAVSARDIRGGLFVSKSSPDGSNVAGKTWTPPILISVATELTVVDDKPSITADPTGANFVYAVWDRHHFPKGTVRSPTHSSFAADQAELTFARSTDGGVSWQPARAIYSAGPNADPASSAQIVVLPNGRLILFFNNFLFHKNETGISDGSAVVQQIAYFFSDDKGSTWQPTNEPGRPVRPPQLRMFPRAIVSSSGTSTYDPHDCADPSDADTCRRIRSVGGRNEIGFDVAVDPRNGALHAVWQDARFSNNGEIGDSNLIVDGIAFSMSTDGGTSWSTPIKVNQTPGDRPLGNQQAFIPSVAVDSSGSVGVTYYDFRNNEAVGPGLATDYWFVRCRSNCGTEAGWRGSEARLTDASFDITKAPNRGGYFVGDYQGLAATDVFLSFFAISNTDFGNIYFRAIGP